MPHFLRHLKSAATRELCQQIRDEWTHQWETEIRSWTTYALTPAPTRDILQLHASVRKALSVDYEHAAIDRGRESIGGLLIVYSREDSGCLKCFWLSHCEYCSWRHRTAMLTKYRQLYERGNFSTNGNITAATIHAALRQRLQHFYLQLGRYLVQQ